ncbi:MAG: hypothetical protein OHK0017_04080 [Patescibacteria group bacterium]
MDTQKLSKILNLIEIAENNLKTAQILLKQINPGGTSSASVSYSSAGPAPVLSADADANYLEVVEGNFDGEHMLGDDGKIYTIPANYASKTKLVVGDRMKRILTDSYREVYKVIQKAPSKRVVGVFNIDQAGEYVIIVDTIPHPVKVLKASITFAMKQQDLKPGDTVAILVPVTIDNSTSTWGAFDTVVKHSDNDALNPDLSSVQPMQPGMNVAYVATPDSRPRPSLDSLKETAAGSPAPTTVDPLDEIPASASMPNPFDSLDEFKI